MVVVPHLLLKLLELAARAGAQLRVEIGQRLVEQEYGRLAHQRAGQRHTLALAARELARPPVKQVVDAEQARPSRPCA